MFEKRHVMRRWRYLHRISESSESVAAAPSPPLPWASLYPVEQGAVEVEGRQTPARRLLLIVRDTCLDRAIQNDRQAADRHSVSDTIGGSVLHRDHHRKRLYRAYDHSFSSGQMGPGRQVLILISFTGGELMVHCMSPINKSRGWPFIGHHRRAF